MSPIGAVLLSILLITGMTFVAGNYTAIGFSKNAWIAVNILIFCGLIGYEVYRKIRHPEDDKDSVEKEN